MADVTHDTILLVTDTIPINIGLLGSYAKALFGNDIEISQKSQLPRKFVLAQNRIPMHPSAGPGGAPPAGGCGHIFF